MLKGSRLYLQCGFRILRPIVCLFFFFFFVRQRRSNQYPRKSHVITTTAASRNSPGLTKLHHDLRGGGSGPITAESSSDLQKRHPERPCAGNMPRLCATSAATRLEHGSGGELVLPLLLLWPTDARTLESPLTQRPPTSVANTTSRARPTSPLSSGYVRRFGSPGSHEGQRRLWHGCLGGESRLPSKATQWWCLSPIEPRGRAADHQPPPPTSAHPDGPTAECRGPAPGHWWTLAPLPLGTHVQLLIPRDNLAAPTLQPQRKQPGDGHERREDGRTHKKMNCPTRPCTLSPMANTNWRRITRLARHRTNVFDATRSLGRVRMCATPPTACDIEKIRKRCQDMDWAFAIETSGSRSGARCGSAHVNSSCTET